MSTAPRTVHMVSVSDLRPSRFNVRRHVNPEALKELTESVKAHGILVPLLVRPLGDGGAPYEVVAGHRRLAAAKAAKLPEAPCEIRALTDRDVLEISVVENLQREDIHPLDEGEGYRALIKEAGYEAQTVAAKVGKSLSYVYQRLKLADLVPKVKEAFLEDRITAGHAILIARLQPKYQEETLAECFEEEWGGPGRGRQKTLVSVRALGAWIAEKIHLDLHAAPWKKDDATLVPKAGPCTTCPKRTGFAPELFPDVAKKDTCTDRACFGEKQDAFLARAKEDLKAKGTAFVEISRDYTGRRDAKGPLNPGAWEEVRGKGCPHVQTGLVVGGEGRGQSLKICAEPNCRIHGQGRWGPVTSPQERARQKKAVQRQRLEGAFRGRLLAAVLTKVPATLGRPELGLVARGYLQEVWHENRVRVLRRRGWIPEKGRAAGSMDHQRIGVKKIEELAPTELGRLLVELSLVRALDVDSYYQGGPKELLTMAKRYKVNLQAVRREVTKAGKPGRGKKR